MKGGRAKTVRVAHNSDRNREEHWRVVGVANVPNNWWISEYGGEMGEEAAWRGREGPDQEGQMYLVDNGNHQ